MKLCITGGFGNKDIGDEAILSEDLNYVLARLCIPPMLVFLIGHQPGYISFYHEHPLENCLACRSFTTSFKQNARAFLGSAVRFRPDYSLLDNSKIRYSQAVARECDALLVTGGGIINTRDSRGTSIKRLHALVKFFHKYEKPIFISGQTIGPLGINAYHDQLAREIVSMAEVLTVRDVHYSKRYLEIIGAEPKELLQLVDDAASLPYQDEKLPVELNEFLSACDTVAVNVTTYTSDTFEKKVAVARICEYCISEYGVNIILVSHALPDFPALWTIYDMVDNTLKPRIRLPDTRLWRATTVKKMISKCRIAIGGRYHFIVFAGTSNTPFVGMPGNHYSYIKQDGFARPLGLEDCILTEKEVWDWPILKQKIDKAFSMQIDTSMNFPRPSISMQRFGDWLNSL